MTPTLKNGQILVVSHDRKRDIDDVVVAYMNGKQVVKRITKMSDGKFYLEGDNKEASTDSNKHGWILDRHIMGKVIWPRTNIK